MNYNKQSNVENAKFDKNFSDRDSKIWNAVSKYIGKDNVIQFNKLKIEINELILEIRELIIKSPPLKLLSYCNAILRISMNGITSEYQMSIDKEFKCRVIDYVQSVIASSLIDETVNEDDFRSNREIIIKKVVELYEKSIVFYMLNSVESITDKHNSYNKYRACILEGSIQWFSKGKRYAIFDIPYLKTILTPHNDMILEIYGVTSEDIVDGLHNIQEALLIKFSNLKREFNNIVSEMEQLELNGDEDLIKFNKFPRFEYLLKFLLGESEDYSLFDLSVLTNWPESLLDDLSWEIGESKDFFEEVQYPGWISRKMPIIRKPFISIEGRYYCFEYNNLFDNFYRVLQKAIISKKNDFNIKWNQKQNEVSELLAVELLSKVLVGCQVFQGNYYKEVGKKNKWCENDALIIYDDEIIILEVKAGSYTHTPILIDLEGNINSLKNLLEKADIQAERFCEYLKSSDCVNIYDSNHNLKTSLSLSSYKFVTKICVMLDEIDEFASRAEKIGFLNIKNDTIFISINDLMVYCDFFDSPIEFLHFLNQRKLAILTENIEFNDEFDHLGMYLKYNTYSLIARNQGKNKKVFWLGYRENLDEYYNQLIFNKEYHNEKPSADISIRIKEIIRLLDKRKLFGKSIVGKFLLEMNEQIKIKFDKNINNFFLADYKSNYCICKYSKYNSNCYIICHESNNSDIIVTNYENYVKSVILKNFEENSIILHLFYNQKFKLVDIKFDFFNYNKIEEKETCKPNDLSGENFKFKIYEYKDDNEIKVGRNDPCICGSKKKFKKCCGGS